LSAEKVDKAWHSKGIEQYSNAAILGTLGHYGAVVTEEEFLALTREKFPLEIALGWHEGWKGKGQFSRFPFAASEELWRRLNGAELSPSDLTLVLIHLLETLYNLLDGKPDDGTLDTRFQVVEAYLPRVNAIGPRREAFLEETMLVLGDEWEKAFDSIAPQLAEKKHLELAQRFVAIDEALFPARQGLSQAGVKAATGDVDGAVADLVALASDAAREPFVRLSAIDGVLHFGQLKQAVTKLVSMVDFAVEKKDAELASAVVDRLDKVIRKDDAQVDIASIRAAISRLAQVFGD
jgi:hypothetical protein